MGVGGGWVGGWGERGMWVGAGVVWVEWGMELGAEYKLVRAVQCSAVQYSAVQCSAVQ